MSTAQRDVELWLNNSEEDYYPAREVVENNVDPESDYPYYDAAYALRDHVTEMLLDEVPNSGMARDLMLTALQSVDWTEVAEGLYPREDFPEQDDNEDD